MSGDVVGLSVFVGGFIKFGYIVNVFFGSEGEFFVLGFLVDE